MSRNQYLQKLLANHHRRLEKLYNKRALQGLSADPSILIEIEDIEAEIEQLQAELEQVESATSSLTGGESKKPHQEDALKQEISGCELLCRLMSCQVKLACVFVKSLIKFFHCLFADTPL